MINIIRFTVNSNSQVLSIDKLFNSYKIGDGLINLVSFDFNEINTYIEEFVVDKINKTNSIKKDSALNYIKNYLPKIHPYFHSISINFVEECVLTYLPYALARLNKEYVFEDKSTHRNIIIYSLHEFQLIADELCFVTSNKDIHDRWSCYVKRISSYIWDSKFRYPLYDIQQKCRDIIIWLSWILDSDISTLWAFDFEHPFLAEFQSPFKSEVTELVSKLNTNQRIKLFETHETDKGYETLDPQITIDGNSRINKEYEDYLNIDPLNAMNYSPKSIYKYDFAQDSQDQKKEFIKNSNEIKEMAKILQLSNIQRYSIYTANSLKEMLYIELINMADINIKVKKCEYCNKFLIVHGNYKIKYCKDCKSKGSSANYRKNVKKNSIKKEFNKAYMRNYQQNHRIQYTNKKNLSNNLKKDIDNKWLAWYDSALRMRDAALNDTISEEEFMKWLNNNRKFY